MKPPVLDEILTKNVDPSAVDEVWRRVETARAARRRGYVLRRAFAGTMLAALVLVVALVYRRAGSHESPALRLASGEALPVLLGGETPNVATFDDGSRVVLGKASALVPTTNADGVVAFDLRQGEALFDVVPRGPRAWTIDAGLAQVSVLGTRFRVVRSAHLVHVEVERGVVRVSGATLPVGGQTLTAGQSVDVADGASERTSDETGIAPSDLPAVDTTTNDDASRDATDAATTASDDGEGVAPEGATVPADREKTGQAGASERASWRPLASKGDFKRAYAVLGKEGLTHETKRASTTAELLRLADVARLSGHPEDAVAPLERILVEHRGDANAALAAFTLGKIRQDALGEPARAADAFETSISLGVPGALREDAFARRVEAYAQAGMTSRAKATRAAYEAEFPSGRHLEAVARWAP